LNKIEADPFERKEFHFVSFGAKQRFVWPDHIAILLLDLCAQAMGAKQKREFFQASGYPPFACQYGRSCAAASFSHSFRRQVSGAKIGLKQEIRERVDSLGIPRIIDYQAGAAT
jgi:hypothetical protein